jgi:hypothetical protein
MDIEIVQTNYTGYSTGKQSYNVMHNLVECAKRTHQYVYMVEDDIMVSNRFFEWHDLAHGAGDDVVCWIASRNNNTRFLTTEDQRAYYIGTTTDYQGLGISYSRDFILEYIAPHDKREYYSQPVNYCRRYFPDSSIGHFFAEQDGLIRRVMEKNGMRAMFPHVAQCYHAGYYGKNRGDMPSRMSLQDKINMISGVIFNPDVMKNSVEHQEWYEDSTPVSLVNEPIGAVHRRDCDHA